MEAPVWTIAGVLTWTQKFFASRGIASARLDAEVLLAHVLQVGRLHLYTHYDQPLTGAERAAFRALVQRRGQHTPVAYLLGTREFYGRAFCVTPDVLVPRPETELLVDAALACLQAGAGAEADADAAPLLLDVGTGSGALAVTLAAEVPAARVVATDISAAALAVAAQNAEAHQVSARIQFAAGHLLTPAAAAGPFALIVANLPYIDAAEAPQLPPDVRAHEPGLALFAGDGGLALIAELCAAAGAHLLPGGHLLCEIGAAQGARARALLTAAGGWQDVRVEPDLAGRPRLLRAARAA